MEAHLWDFACCSDVMYDTTAATARHYDLPRASYVGMRVRAWRELLGLGVSSADDALQSWLASAAAAVPAVVRACHYFLPLYLNHWISTRLNTWWGFPVYTDLVPREPWRDRRVVHTDAATRCD